jgi:hypothetical protein
MTYYHGTSIPGLKVILPLLKLEYLEKTLERSSWTVYSLRHLVGQQRSTLESVQLNLAVTQ